MNFEIQAYHPQQSDLCWSLKGTNSLAQLLLANGENLNNATIEFINEEEAVIEIGQSRFFLSLNPVEHTVSKYLVYLVIFIDFIAFGRMLFEKMGAN
jgi:hypothetical protein